MRWMLLVLAVAAMVRIPGVARAQLPVDADTTRVVRFGLTAGAGFPVGDISDSWDAGAHGGMFLFISPPRFPLAIRVSLDAHRYGQKPTPEAGLSGRSIMLSGAANLSYTFPGAGSVRPYVTAGPGGYYIDTEIDGSDTADPKKKGRFGLNAGAGIGFDVGSLTGFVEGGLVYVFTDGDTSGAPLPSSTTLIPVSVGIIF